MAKTKPVLNPMAEAIVKSAIALYEHDAKGLLLAGSMSGNIKTAYLSCKSQTEFLNFFGSGGNNKVAGFVQGVLYETTAIMVSDFDKVKANKVKAKFSQRIMEARKLYASGQPLIEGKDVQSSWKAIEAKAKAVTKAEVGTTPEQPSGTDWDELGKVATMDEIAQLVSAYVAHHGMTATRALASQLRDFMPITVQKAKQA